VRDFTDPESELPQDPESEARRLFAEAMLSAKSPAACERAEAGLVQALDQVRAELAAPADGAGGGKLFVHPLWQRVAGVAAAAMILALAFFVFDQQTPVAQAADFAERAHAASLESVDRRYRVTMDLELPRLIGGVREVEQVLLVDTRGEDFGRVEFVAGPMKGAYLGWNPEGAWFAPPKESRPVILVERRLDLPGVVADNQSEGPPLLMDVLDKVRDTYAVEFDEVEERVRPDEQVVRGKKLRRLSPGPEKITLRARRSDGVTTFFQGEWKRGMPLQKGRDRRVFQYTMELTSEAPRGADWYEQDSYLDPARTRIGR
jgi:hypothetical protein